MKGLRKKQLRGETGQSLIVVTFALPVFLAIALVVVDGSLGFAGKRQMQNAADAAALAASRELTPALDPSCTSNTLPCFTTTRTNVAQIAAVYSAKNGGPNPVSGSLPACGPPSDTDCYTWPYPSDGGPGSPSWGKVEVRVHTTVNTFFTPIFGIAAGFLKPKARAVAAAIGITHTYCLGEDGNPDPTLDPNSIPPCFKAGNPGTNAFAFAHSTSCTAITISNNEQNYNAGALWSNGGISTNGLTGGTKNYAKLYYLGNPACAVSPFVVPNSKPNFIDCGATAPPCSWPGGTWVNYTPHASVAAGTWPIPLPNTPAICPTGTYGNGGNVTVSTWIANHRGDISGSDMATTNGSTTVTAASGGFIANDLGRKINIGGTVYEIATRVNATTITLTTAYSGPTATNVAWYSAGIYCFTGTVTIDTTFTSYMFVTTSNQSNSIKNNGGPFTWTGSLLMAKVMNLVNPNAKPMLYTTAGGIALSNPITLNGDSFVPNGTFNVTGSGTNTGFIEADKIVSTQSGTTFVGDGPGPDATPDIHGTLKTDVTGANLRLDE